MLTVSDVPVACSGLERVRPPLFSCAVSLSSRLAKALKPGLPTVEIPAHPVLQKDRLESFEHRGTPRTTRVALLKGLAARFWRVC